MELFLQPWGPVWDILHWQTTMFYLPSWKQVANEKHHNSKTWPVRKAAELIRHTEMRIIRQMSGVKLKDRDEK